MKLEATRTLWSLTEGERGRYLAAILALFAGNAALLGVPFVSGRAIDVLQREGAIGARRAALAAAAVVSLTALGGLLQYVRGRLAAEASEGLARRLRERLFAHLEHLPMTFHDRADTGDLVQRATSDVETVRVFLAQQVVEIGRAVLLAATSFPLLWWLDHRLAWASFALYPPIVAFAIVFFRRIRAVFRAQDEAEGRMTTVLQENLTGVRVVRAFGRGDHERARFEHANAAFRDGTLRLIRLLGSFWATSDLLCFGQIAIVLFTGARFAAAGEIGIGTLFTFLGAQTIVIWPVRHMGRVLADAGKATVAIERLREVLDEREETEASVPADSAPPERFAGELVVSDLSFAYDPGGADALSGVSFRVAPGETLALVGAPGAGKSTLLALLLRLYDYERGSIRLDGHELADLPRAVARRQFASVLQEPFLFSRSIAENLRVGRESAAEDELVRAADSACVHASIEAFRSGYDTLVGERGVTLSGGQRQRVAIARALLADAPVLILDDALSAVDTRTERGILDAIERRGRRTTTLIAAHRLSTVARADRILVLEQGRVAQVGTHAELAGVEGPYRRLWEIQGVLEDDLDLMLGESDALREAAPVIGGDAP